MLDEILSIQEIKQKKESILKLEKEMCSPLLTDFSFIPIIYEWFKSYMNELNCPINPLSVKHSVKQRKKFILVILYLFAPASIVGNKMPNRLRETIANTLGIEKHSIVSICCKDLVFSLRYYKDFKRDAEGAFRFIHNKLVASKII